MISHYGSWAMDHAAGIAAIVLLSFGLTSVIAICVVVRLPADFLRIASRQPGRRSVREWSAFVLKNLLGLFLIVAGAVLALPGMPGQGLLMIAVGLMVSDLPGREPWLRRMLEKRSIRVPLNRLRRLFSRAPLLKGRPLLLACSSLECNRCRK